MTAYEEIIRNYFSSSDRSKCIKCIGDEHFEIVVKCIFELGDNCLVGATEEILSSETIKSMIDNFEGKVRVKNGDSVFICNNLGYYITSVPKGLWAPQYMVNILSDDDLNKIKKIMEAL